MHTVHALVLFSGESDTHFCPGDFTDTTSLSHTDEPVPMKEPWRIWVNKSHESNTNSDMTQTKASQNRMYRFDIYVPNRI